MPRKIEISHRTIVFTVLFLVFLWFVYLVREILLQFFVALLIMTILNPTVTKLSKYKIPRSASVFLVYLLLLGVMSFAVVSVMPPLIEQTSSFIINLPTFLNNLGLPSVFRDQFTQQVLAELGSLPARLARVTISLFSNVLGVVAVLVFAFYLLAERGKLDEQLGIFLGDSKKKKIARLVDLLENRLGGWARGQLTLMFVVGLANYIGLRLLGIPFALPLAILAGLLEIVPYIGPILAAVPAVLIGLGISPIIGVAAASLAFLIQQLENYLFVPKIMQKSAGVNPIVTLFSLAVGLEVAGIVGLLISVPVYITVKVLAGEYLLKNK